MYILKNLPNAQIQLGPIGFSNFLPVFLVFEVEVLPEEIKLLAYSRPFEKISYTAWKLELCKTPAHFGFWHASGFTQNSISSDGVSTFSIPLSRNDRMTRCNNRLAML